MKLHWNVATSRDPKKQGQFAAVMLARGVSPECDLEDNANEFTTLNMLKLLQSFRSVHSTPSISPFFADDR